MATKKTSKKLSKKTSPSPTKFKSILSRPDKPAEPLEKLPNVLVISRKAITTLWDNKLLFGGIAGVYALLLLVLVRGIGNSENLLIIKDLVSGTFPGLTGQLTTGFALFATLFTPQIKDPNDYGGILHFFLILLTSLAVVWALRRVRSGEKLRVRDGFYKGAYPLVPVLLVLGVMLVELLPAAFGATVYRAVLQNNIANTFIEQAFWLFFLGFFVVMSLYLWASSIMALYIVSLPDMQPVAALKSAHKLTRWRRWAVLRKIVFLPIALFAISSAIMVPLLLVATPLAPWVFFVLGVLGILVVHAYLYTLYRELLA